MRPKYTDLISFYNELVLPDIKETWRSMGFLRTCVAIPFWYTIMFFAIMYLGISALTYAFIDLIAGCKSFKNRLLAELQLWQWARFISTQNDAINAIKVDGRIFKYLKNYNSDISVIHAALVQKSNNFKYVSKDVLNNTILIRELIYRRPLTHHVLCEGYKFLSKRVRNDKHLAVIAVSNNILNLKFLSHQLKNNKAFLCSAIQDNSSIDLYWQKFKLTHIPKKLRCDKDILNLIITANPKIVLTKEFIKTSKFDYNFFITALSQDASIFCKLPTELKLERSLLIAALSAANANFFFRQLISQASSTLKDDSNIAKIALVREIDGYKYFSYRVRKIKRICLLAIKLNANNYKYSGKKLQRDQEIIDKVYKFGVSKRKSLCLKALDRSNIKLLLQQGIAAKAIYKYVYVKERRSKYLYVEALNAKPQLITLENSFNAILKLDFSKLNLNARKMCYQQFKKLYAISKKNQALDILEVANKYKDTAKIMLLNKNNSVDRGL